MITLTEESIKIIEEEEEIIQQIIYKLGKHWSTEMIHMMAVAIYIKRGDNLYLTERDKSTE